MTMIGLDTNVIIRLLINDDKKQAKRVVNFLNELEKQGDQAYISNLVVLECMWVLQSRYKMTSDLILMAFEELCKSPVIQFENQEIILKIASNRQNNSVGLTDQIISLDYEFKKTKHCVSFDKKAIKSGLFQKL